MISIFSSPPLDPGFGGIDPDQLAGLIDQRKWVPLAAVVIGFVVRLLKSDTKIPITIPPRARIFIVFGLGVASSVLEKVVEGKTWTSALVGGAVSVAMAVLLHETVIASIRGGKEIPIPGLMIPGAAPSPGAPVTVPPPSAAANDSTVPITVDAPPGNEPDKR